MIEQQSYSPDQVNVLVAQARRDERKRCADWLDEIVKVRYPTSVYPAPYPGEHGTSVDSCGAAALRNIIPELAYEIRALEDT